MKEGNIQRAIQLFLSRFQNVRLFRNNVGQGWVGQLISNKNGTVTLANARPLHAGLCDGSSDLIGWKTVEITPEMVGQKIAVFTAVEIKTEKGRPTEAQNNFLSVVNRSGGIGFVARNENEAVRGLGV